LVGHQLPLDFGGRGSTLGRNAAWRTRDTRERTVRQVEFSQFPRATRGDGTQLGFTRDESASGMCLGADHAEPLGALLRIVVRGTDGRPALDCVARVVWTRERNDGRWWLGVQIVQRGSRLALAVRPTRRTRVVRVTA
jgi:hypothetical protein